MGDLGGTKWNMVGTKLKGEMVGVIGMCFRDPWRGSWGSKEHAGGVPVVGSFLSPITALLRGPRSTDPGQKITPIASLLNWLLQFWSGPDPKPTLRMEERQEWPLLMPQAPEPPLVNACQLSAVLPLRCWQSWWAGLCLCLGLPPSRSLCPAWRKALLSSAAPRPEHLGLFLRVCGLQFALP